jgi:hypothetical protein
MNWASVVHRLSAARPPLPPPANSRQGGQEWRSRAGAAGQGQPADGRRRHSWLDRGSTGRHPGVQACRHIPQQTNRRAGILKRRRVGGTHMGRPLIRRPAAQPPGAAAAAWSAAPPSHRVCGSPFAAAAAASAGCRDACSSSSSSNGQQCSAGSSTGEGDSTPGRGAVQCS